ncbi:histidinol-phosphate transaminase [Nocardioides sp. Kera G14]|uniref:histidinol-phosphate transaminase n=1 Tax=Nocardioides sp. Kera G14 TaxID=2884264 RepID=UPI001D12C281|nr:histidinol-phosphate transaminase [Nocardioides sp. Kera G14]UDY24991.1 histidinol-phosphate transaminase [Nocardioides sp. Kera G14]
MTPTLPGPVPRSLLSQLPAYVAGRRAAGAEVAALASNESHFAPLPAVVDAISQGAARVNRYPDPQGLELRAAIAKHVGAGTDEVAIGPGSSGVLQQLLTALCEPGDEVIHAWRSFEAYPILVRLAGAVAVGVPLAGERHDLAAMAAAVTDRTRLILLCTPNNPTGVALTTAEVDDLLARVPQHVLVAIDEAYVEYDDSGFDGLELLRRHPNVCLVRTFSKAHGLAGLRVGYAVARPEIAEAVRRTMLTFAVTDLAQSAALASLAAVDEMERRVREVRAERERMIARLRELGWETPDSQANFVWLRCSDERREHLMESFDHADVLVRGYAGDGIRITIADRVANDRALAVLAPVGALA